ncbi:hypothetical protein [Williamsia sp. DF01-3]|uniref:hypothetical protein n=1 Tax=Williamsia sp. DF01-3 TaxID=2934157 RepID=UPI001FF674BA|nr:hypothetical protein [Williamsia sp. DF01-3]MCK0517093.1 hypothetical protein [Williamsia sp. DF01-3]
MDTIAAATHAETGTKTTQTTSSATVTMSTLGTVPNDPPLGVVVVTMKSGCSHLNNDIGDGTWDRRYGHLNVHTDYDGGYRLIIGEPKSTAAMKQTLTMTMSGKLDNLLVGLAFATAEEAPCHSCIACHISRLSPVWHA